MPILVQILLIVVGTYLLVGLVFAVPFVVAGAPRIAPAARDATWGFRLIIVPGVAALWPCLAWRWWRSGPGQEHNAHRDCARNPEAKP